MNAGQPITHCPVCRYDLAGLPKNHRCPECGFEYDETMMVWNTRGNGWMVWGLPSFMVLNWCISFFRDLARFRSGRGTPDWFDFGMGLLIPVIAIFILLSWRRGGSVTIGRGGFVYRFPFRRPRTLRWDEVDFPVAGRLPRHVKNELLLVILLPTGGMSSYDRQHLLFQMYDRWKRFHENQRVPDRPPQSASVL